MALRFWNDSEAPEAKLRDHNLRAHEQLCRAHAAWFWLCGPGSSDLLGAAYHEGSRIWDVYLERRQAERDCRSNAWTADTLRQVHGFVERLRARAKSPPPSPTRRARTARKDLDLDGSGSSDTLDATLSGDVGLGRILPTVGRDWPEQFSLSDEERAERWREVVRKWPAREIPREERNHAHELVSQARAMVLFDGDDQGNEYEPEHAGARVEPSAEELAEEFF